MTVPTHIALDQSACIRSQANIGETIAHNICDGTSAVVPWGSVDWLAFWALCGIGGLLGLMIVGLAALMVRTMLEGW